VLGNNRRASQAHHVNVRLLLAFCLLVITAIVMAAIMLDLISVGLLVGPYRFSHWTTWIGSTFVAVYAPAYHVLKRICPKRTKTLLDIHNFGFLLAFLLVSIHFAGQMSRPPQAFPDLGEGIALYVTMVLLVATGMVQRFGTQGLKGRFYSLRTNRAVHVSLLSAFYIVIVVHALGNLGFL
jgi:hypothetical protein